MIGWSRITRISNVLGQIVRASFDENDNDIDGGAATVTIVGS